MTSASTIADDDVISLVGSLAVDGPGVYDNLPEDVYHADPVEGGSLSKSGAKLLLPPSCPALFDYKRTHPDPPKNSFDVGHAAHKLVLGVGAEIVTVPDEMLASNGAWSTSAAKAFVEEARAAGKVVIKAEDHQMVQDMAAALREHPLASVLLEPGTGTPEASMFWRDPVTGVMLRGRLDWLPDPGPGRFIIPDYKTALSAEPSQFVRSAADYGYHMQAPWYADGVVELDLADDALFVFVVQEKRPPYLVTVVELDANAMRIGRIVNRQAIDIYAECVSTGRWPGYSDDVALASLPSWIERNYEDM